jgi:hypothetical protein
MVSHYGKCDSGMLGTYLRGVETNCEPGILSGKIFYAKGLRAAQGCHPIYPHPVTKYKFLSIKLSLGPSLDYLFLFDMH